MMQSMDDWNLIQDYAQTGSETAFAELAHRHIDWIYSVAIRQVGDPHLAQDVVQLVLVLLARKAGGFRPGTLLGGWLFRTTCFVSKCALRAEPRRKHRENQASAMMTDQQNQETEQVWEQLVPHLDQAVAALPKTDRTAITLTKVR